MSQDREQDRAPLTVLPPAGVVAQKIETSYCTAVSVQRPRVVASVEKRILDEAALAGDAMYFSWPVKEKQEDGSYRQKIIVGPSIKLANSAAREWGNCAVEMQRVEEDATSWTFYPAFVDLETGFTMCRAHRARKSIGFGGKDRDRQVDMAFEKGQSLAIRNLITNSLPRWLIDKAVETAQEAERKKLTRDKIEDSVRKGLAAIGKCGVTEGRVLARFERKSKSEITIDDLVALKGIVQAITQGGESVESFFPLADTNGAKASPLDGMKPTAPQEQALATPQEPPDAVGGNTTSPPPANGGDERKTLLDQAGKLKGIAGQKEYYKFLATFGGAKHANALSMTDLKQFVTGLDALARAVAAEAEKKE